MSEKSSRPESPGAPPATGFFGHPAGLSTLFFTELWERFSYYGMRAILILFMTASKATGGLGLDVVTAGAVYGMYTSGVYMLSLPGGWLADRILGQRKTVFLGGSLIAAGQFLLALPLPWTFYLGLVVIVFGTGMLKPNASTIVGKLYQPGDQRRDAGFSIFYMGINTGAFISPLIVGWVGQRINWHWGFALAGVGMLVGLAQYTLGAKRMGDAGLYPVAPRDAAEAARQKRFLVAGALALAGLAIVIGALALAGVLTPVRIADLFGVLLLVTVAGSFGSMIFSPGWTPVERKRIIVTFVMFLAASLFWSEFEQAGSTLNLFADRSTRNEILGFSFPASWMQSVQALFIIIFAPVFAWLWLKLGRRDPSSPVKFSLGLLFVGASFALMSVAAVLAGTGTRVSPLWLTATYLLHTFGELCLSPVGLSAMTKLAPARVAGLVMGMWFLSNATGNYLGGRLASFYESFPLPHLFGLVAAMGVAAGLVMFALTPLIRKLMGGVK